MKWFSDLAAIEIGGAHDGAERTDVEEVFAHPVARFLNWFTIFCFPRELQEIVRFLLRSLESLPGGNDLNAVTRDAILAHGHIVADFAFEADIGDEPLKCFGIDRGAFAESGSPFGLLSVQSNK